jgi:hypothetical protein
MPTYIITRTKLITERVIVDSTCKSTAMREASTKKPMFKHCIEEINYKPDTWEIIPIQL